MEEPLPPDQAPPALDVTGAGAQNVRVAVNANGSQPPAATATTVETAESARAEGWLLTE